MPVKAVSKRELQAWVSDTTGEQCSNLNKDCASGVLPITLLNTLHPNAVDARKMNRNASTEDQFLQNYKVLEAAFRKLGIEQAAALVNNSAEQLAKGQPQSTLELMQNMYAMVAFAGSTYGEKTESSYCTYHEVKYAYDNKVPMVPVKLCAEWPPNPTPYAAATRRDSVTSPE